MTEAEIIRMMRDHFERLFPRDCPNCHRRFVTLREYILSTQRIGATISYDAELGDWKTTQPLGAAAHANCPCGSTLTLTTEGMPLAQIHQVLEWVKNETQRRGLSSEAVISQVRTEIRRQILAEAAD